MPSKLNSKTLEEQIVAAKRSGLTDKQIGKKFKVSFNVIEKAVIKVTGINVTIPNKERKAVKSWEPKKFKLEQSTVWSFKSRGNWATHTGNYRGNWSPYIPRNIILKYSKEGDNILDCFCGSGVTAVECKLLNRNFFGIDINPNAIMLAKENIDNIPITLFGDSNKPRIDINVGDARGLSFLKDNSIDLICTHPPYADILKYTDNYEQDLSFLKIDDFLESMEKVIKENHRVLKNGRQCAVLIGDMRKKKHVVPLGFRLIEKYLNNGFVIKELIIKRQHNCRTTGFWYKNSIKYNFLLLAHEYLVVFQKSSRTKKSQPKFPNPKDLEKVYYNIEKDKVETMTVWVTTPESWYEHVITNLVSRYDGENYRITNNPKKIRQIKNKLLDLIIFDIRHRHLPELSEVEIINASLEEKGFLTILCEDIRLKDGTLFPMAIHTVKEVSKTLSLKIREIIIISVENSKTSKNNNGTLEINHKYLLVYQKTSS